jgi:hypothetical protein
MRRILASTLPICRHLFGIRNRFQLVSIEWRLVAQNRNGGGEGIIILECLQNENVISLCA